MRVGEETWQNDGLPLKANGAVVLRSPSTATREALFAFRAEHFPQTGLANGKDYCLQKQPSKCFRERM